RTCAGGCASLAATSGGSIDGKSIRTWRRRPGCANLECSRLRRVIVCPLKYYGTTYTPIPSRGGTRGKSSDAQSCVTSHVAPTKGYGRQIIGSAAGRHSTVVWAWAWRH